MGDAIISLSFCVSRPCVCAVASEKETRRKSIRLSTSRICSSRKKSANLQQQRANVAMSVHPTDSSAQAESSITSLGLSPPPALAVLVRRSSEDDGEDNDSGGDVPAQLPAPKLRESSGEKKLRGWRWSSPQALLSKFDPARAAAREARAAAAKRSPRFYAFWRTGRPHAALTSNPHASALSQAHLGWPPALWSAPLPSHRRRTDDLGLPGIGSAGGSCLCHPGQDVAASPPQHADLCRRA